MEKKLIALGPKTRKSYNITLPIDWVRSQGLDKSKKADLEIIGNTIIVRPFAKEVKRVVLDIKQIPHSYNRIIQILYKKGIDEIKVVNANPVIINTVSEIIEQRCIGFELIDQGRDYCIIKDVAKESVENFQVLLRRSFLIVLQLAEETGPESVKNLDKSLNKITAYCQRLLSKQGYSDFENVNNYNKLCTELEHIGDEYKHAYDSKIKIGKDNLHFLKQAYELFYKFNQKEFDSIQAGISEQRGKGNHYERTIRRLTNTILGIIYALKG